MDTKARRVTLPSGRHCIMSDTVGFISDLPHQLVNAFRATLEEVLQADVLLHVLDAANPAVEDQHATVLGVLQQLGLGRQALQGKVVEVWNKVDLLQQTQGAGVATKLASLPPEALQHAGQPPDTELDLASSQGDSAMLQPVPHTRLAPADAVPISVVQGQGLQELLQRLDAKLAAMQQSDS